MTTERPPAACRCVVGTVPCTRAATQEDLLCDMCRRSHCQDYDGALVFYFTGSEAT